MEKFLAMILTAYDPRKNPAAGLLWYHASRSWRFLVQLCRSEGPRSGSAREYYTINHTEPTDDQKPKRTVKALTSSGQLVDVDVEMSL